MRVEDGLVVVGVVDQLAGRRGRSTFHPLVQSAGASTVPGRFVGYPRTSKCPGEETASRAIETRREGRDRHRHGVERPGVRHGRGLGAFAREGARAYWSTRSGADQGDARLDRGRRWRSDDRHRRSRREGGVPTGRQRSRHAFRHGRRPRRRCRDRILDGNPRAPHRAVPTDAHGQPHCSIHVDQSGDSGHAAAPVVAPS